MIALINYGMGNLQSVAKALEKAGSRVMITSDSKAIARADAVVLPGVGAFSDAMKNLGKSGMASCILEAIDKGKPFLGICLGLQLLFSVSDEGKGNCAGLDILKGRVVKFGKGAKKALKVPHMGWNSIEIKQKKGIFSRIPDSSFMYFAHSYYVEPEEKNVIAATTGYGINFVSAVSKGNIHAVQFHPEKSGETGLKILKNFCGLIP